MIETEYHLILTVEQNKPVAVVAGSKKKNTLLNMVDIPRNRRRKTAITKPKKYVLNFESIDSFYIHIDSIFIAIFVFVYSILHTCSSQIHTKNESLRNRMETRKLIIYSHN